jgi:hypothetical protein
MSKRWVAVAAGCALACVALGSCSSEQAQQPSGGGTAGTGGGVMTDASDGAAGDDATADVSTDPVEDKKPPIEAASEKETAPAACPPGSWGTVNFTNCDAIKQDCPSGQTCQPSFAFGKTQTKCLQLNNGLKTRGQTCADQSECAAGLKCVFDRCSPYCCPELQYDICGPGGLCNVSGQVGTNDTIKSCSYQKPCTLWLHECDPGEGCHPVAPDGSAACVPPSGGTPGKDGDACQYMNDCGDDMICAGGTFGGTCRYLCKKGDTPFDAGSPDAGPGNGGCPSGQTCSKGLQDYPDWIGVCDT